VKFSQKELYFKCLNHSTTTLAALTCTRYPRIGFVMLFQCWRESLTSYSPCLSRSPKVIITKQVQTNFPWAMGGSFLAIRQTQTNKLSMGHGGSFLAIRQTQTNKLSTGHGALFLQLGKLEQTNFLQVIGSFLACKQTSILCTVAMYHYG